ncbi:unnamed protein product [Protopolystoma xenopodis]|uniref:Uncharacterized protein n=1 Tax=Protopolystoma xenopodis TaxID=117903 RepID=A0A448WCE1_9PLAT|nr:unnamed protein product [Protopolystoma xenopodis]
MAFSPFVCDKGFNFCSPHLPEPRQSTAGAASLSQSDLGTGVKTLDEEPGCLGPAEEPLRSVPGARPLALETVGASLIESGLLGTRTMESYEAVVASEYSAAQVSVSSQQNALKQWPLSCSELGGSKG